VLGLVWGELVVGCDACGCCPQVAKVIFHDSALISILMCSGAEQSLDHKILRVVL